MPADEPGDAVQVHDVVLLNTHLQPPAGLPKKSVEGPLFAAVQQPGQDAVKNPPNGAVYLQVPVFDIQNSAGSARYA